MSGTGDGGRFGTWSEDADGLVAFDYALADGPAGLELPAGDGRRPWHQVGNDRLVATAHAGGWTTLYVTDRAYMRLSDLDPTRPRGLGGRFRVRLPDGRAVLDPFGPPAAPPVEVTTRWGTGYAEWTVVEVEGPASLRRRVWAPFGDVPALRIDMELRGLPPGAVLEERWGLAWHPVIFGPLMTRGQGPLPSQRGLERLLWRTQMGLGTASRSAVEGLAHLYARCIATSREALPGGAGVLVRPRYRGPFAPSERATPWAFDAFPKAVFLATLSTPATAPASLTETRPGEARELGLDVPLAGSTNGDGSLHVSLAIGWEPEGGVPPLLDRLRAETWAASAARWRSTCPRVELPSAPELAREAAWHGYYLRSAQVHDDHFDERILPQGSAYSYIQGLHGAARDYCLASVPLNLVDPAGARGCLRLLMRMMTPDGRLYYAHTGSGLATTAGMHHSPSDQPLFFLWALVEHVWMTGDLAFLDERVPFLRPGQRVERASGGGAPAGDSTVRERVVLTLRYLQDRVGLGEHGLLRVRSGDWNDPISLMVRSRRAFHARGESGFNSAFACYVLPRVAALLEPTHPEVAAEARALAADLRQAMERCWTGRWFLRGWDGEGRAIGDDHLFLEGQVFALIARLGTDEQRRTLVGEIAARLDDPSPIGANILDRPHPVRLGILPPGWDCNGGVWAALNGLLAWGYALHDPERAWRSLRKQSLAAHARAYPHVWYGVWSGPDAYNAHWADHPGETFVHAATPMREFPLMNSNAHGSPLLALLRLVGVETTARGIEITQRQPAAGPWSLETPLLALRHDGERLHAATRAVEGIGGLAPLVVQA